MTYKLTIGDGYVSCSVCWILDNLQISVNEVQRVRINSVMDDAALSGTFEDDQVAAVRNVAKACPLSIITIQ